MWQDGGAGRGERECTCGGAAAARQDGPLSCWADVGQEVGWGDGVLRGRLWEVAQAAINGVGHIRGEDVGSEGATGEDGQAEAHDARRDGASV